MTKFTAALPKTRECQPGSGIATVTFTRQKFVNLPLFRRQVKLLQKSVFDPLLICQNMKKLLHIFFSVQVNVFLKENKRTKTNAQSTNVSSSGSCITSLGATAAFALPAFMHIKHRLRVIGHFFQATTPVVLCSTHSHWAIFFFRK